MENIEKKKKYQSPEMEIVEMRGAMNLLECSGANCQDVISIEVEDEEP